MGWSVGFDEKWQRDIGYGVPAQCDLPGCHASIDRGLYYVCTDEEPYGGEDGCGLYFCDQHRGWECRHVFKDAPNFEPSSDSPAWIDHKLTDESWQEWRDSHPDEVARLSTSLSEARV